MNKPAETSKITPALIRRSTSSFSWLAGSTWSSRIVQLVRHVNFTNAWFVVLSVTLMLLLFQVPHVPAEGAGPCHSAGGTAASAVSGADCVAWADWALSEDQLVGLRFAGDDEVVALARQALEEKLSRKQIKERIRNWRADDWRV